MTIDQHIQANANDDDALAAYEADGALWKPAAAKSVRAWIGDNARLRKLRAAVASTPPAELPAETAAQYMVLQDAIETLLLSIAAPDSELLLAPGDKHRQALEGAVAFGWITAGDAADLLAAARPASYQPYTVEQIAARRIVLAQEAATLKLQQDLAAANAAAIAVYRANPAATHQELSAAYAARLAELRPGEGA